MCVKFKRADKVNTHVAITRAILRYVQAKKAMLDTEEGPGEVYRTIKARLFRFLETSTEKQFRIRNEWQTLSKIRGMTAPQLEGEWEQVQADLEEVGLGIGSKSSWRTL